MGPLPLVLLHGTSRVSHLVPPATSLALRASRAAPSRERFFLPTSPACGFGVPCEDCSVLSVPAPGCPPARPQHTAPQPGPARCTLCSSRRTRFLGRALCPPRDARRCSHTWFSCLCASELVTCENCTTCYRQASALRSNEGKQSPHSGAVCSQQAGQRALSVHTLEARLHTVSP